MFEYLTALRSDWSQKELEVLQTLVEICAKYDELCAQYQATPTEKLLAASKKLDAMRFETASSVGVAALRGDFSQPTRPVFCLQSDLLATI